MALEEEKGVPLSVRMASGRPYCLKRRWKAARVPRVLGRGKGAAAEQVAAVEVGDG